MSSLPDWLNGYASFDDEALALLGNRGLLRRAARETTTLISADAEQISVAVGDAAPVTVRLLPGGPQAARCPCPVAGVCVHVIAVCLWARRAGGARPEPDADVVAEILSWDPEQINRAAGAAAVRRAKNQLPDSITLTPTGSHLTLSWPDSPQIVAVAGGDFASLLVSEASSPQAENAWKLAAVAAVFAAQGRPWPWPADSIEDSAARTEAAQAVVQAAEETLRSGLSQLRPGDIDQLSTASGLARLAKLSLLARITGAAAGSARAVSQRSDDTGEAQLLSDLAQAWALATAVGRSPHPPAHLVGTAADSASGLSTLVPLSAQWWRAPSGARGLTMHMWHAATGEVLSVTDGRAAATDPGFERSWDRPLLWGASMSALCAGPFELVDSERRPDGSLSPTRRTSVTGHQRFDRDGLAALADQVNQFEAGSAAAQFGLPRARLQMILPRRQHGAAPLELDEVRQLVVWEVIDAQSAHHRLTLGVHDPGLPTLGWVIAKQLPIVAVVAVDGTPRSVFVEADDTLRLIPLTLDISPGWTWDKKLQARLDRLREHRRAAPATSADPLTSCLDAVAELLTALATTGGHPSPRQRESLQRRGGEAAGFGLHSLSVAISRLDAHPTAPHLLSAQFLLDRTRALLEAAGLPRSVGTV